MSTQTPYCIVHTAIADEGLAEALAQKIVEAKLAACVQIHKIKSFYVWQGKPCSEPEYLLIIKTRTAQYQALEDFIRQQHSYEVPEIIQTPITTGFSGYLRWMDNATNS